MDRSAPACVRCGKPVLANRQQYVLFEQRHWLCFHLDFEHQGDPDEPCSDPGCPWFHLDVFKAELRRRGADPDAVVAAAVQSRYAEAHRPTKATTQRMAAPRFEVEQILPFQGEVYIIARLREPAGFRLEPGCTLGGVTIRPWLTQPRALGISGEPRLDVYAFVLADAADAARLSEGTEVELSEPSAV